MSALEYGISAELAALGEPRLAPLALATRADPDPHGELCGRLAIYDQRAADARRGVRWLLGLGVRILSITQYSQVEKPQIVVASGARLRQLGTHDVAYLGQHREGRRMVLTYALEHAGCLIRWQESEEGEP